MPDEVVAASGIRPQVRLTTSSGSVTLVAERRDDIEVDSGGGEVKRYPSSEVEAINVRGSASVELRCPAGSDVVVGTRSGAVRMRGELGDVRVTTHSGSISVGDVESADLRTASGSVEVHHCDTVCRVTTSSGSVEIRAAVDADVRGGSGTVRVSSGTATVRTVSGTVELAATGDSSVDTVSGAITVSLPPHVHPRVAMRGSKSPKIKVSEGDDCKVSLCSLSGKVTVRSR